MHCQNIACKKWKNTIWITSIFWWTTTKIQWLDCPSLTCNPTRNFLFQTFKIIFYRKIITLFLRTTHSRLNLPFLSQTLPKLKNPWKIKKSLPTFEKIESQSVQFPEIQNFSWDVFAGGKFQLRKDTLNAIFATKSIICLVFKYLPMLRTKKQKKFALYAKSRMKMLIFFTTWLGNLCSVCGSSTRTCCPRK